MKAKTKDEIDQAPRLHKLALAKRLGITRPTLDHYLNMNGAPDIDAANTYDVSETAAWIEKNATHVGGAPVGLNEWRIEKIKLDCQRVRDQLARERGDYISKSEASRTILPLMKELSDLIRQKFVQELPSRYKGRDTIDCAQLNDEACDFIATRYKAGVKEFVE